MTDLQMPRKPRTAKSPQEKAQEALVAAQAREEKAHKAWVDTRAAAKAAEAEHARAQQIAEYAAKHPDLPQQTTDTTSVGGWSVGTSTSHG